MLLSIQAVFEVVLDVCRRSSQPAPLGTDRHVSLGLLGPIEREEQGLDTL